MNRLVCWSVAACLTACLAVVEGVGAKPGINLPLTKTAILFALTLIFGHFALRAIDLFLCNVRHALTVAHPHPLEKCRW
jgi:hypothetical protein